jgi:hypothetical protein
MLGNFLKEKKKAEAVHHGEDVDPENANEGVPFKYA